MKLIQIVDVDDETVYINPQHIVTVTSRASDGHATIVTLTGQRLITKQKARDVLDALGFNELSSTQPSK